MSWKLAIDTSSQVSFLALQSPQGEIVELNSTKHASHIEELAQLVKELLENNHITTDELSELIIGSGPGSFTGLRIGFSFMKGLAFSKGIPLVAFNSLIAASHAHIDANRLVVSFSDARRNQVFAAICTCCCNKKIQAVIEPAIFHVDDLLVCVDNIQTEMNYRLDPLFIEIDSAEQLSTNYPRQKAVPWAADLIKLAYSLPHDRYSLTHSLAELEPTYIRAVAAKTIAERLNNQSSRGG